ncbi:hypothetical protein F4778DRAFT_783509 [Xylariomycetidae sp. FL2044]|nr:hypothetical protein F4778DRAFT_783509 [Xylariomycetidae sp. FL2044]
MSFADELVSAQTSAMQLPSATGVTSARASEADAETAEFRELVELREKGWNNPAGDTFFARQRHQADNASAKNAAYFFDMMKQIAKQLDAGTGIFRILRNKKKKKRETTPSVVDLCAAPGGFLAAALKVRPEAEVVAFSLPVPQGGHAMLLEDVQCQFADITMFAADMGVAAHDIPDDHPDASNFVTEPQLRAEQKFDLAICDGQILRNHARAEYREPREARRLTVTQLSLSLEHLKPGGTLVVLLHRVEAWETVRFLYTASKFATVKLYKPLRAHAKRSSFYMVATNVQSQSSEALAAVERWKKVWRVATFGAEEEYQAAIGATDVKVENLLEEFGEDFVKMARPVWRIQADALARASFIKGT